MESTLISEHEGVASALAAYVEGARKADSSIMAGAFHPEATVRGQQSGRLIDLSCAEFFSWVDNSAPALGLKAHLASIDIGSEAAIARLQCTDWLGVDYIDMFTLLRRDGRWKIVSKVFDGQPRNPSGQNSQG